MVADPLTKILTGPELVKARSKLGMVNRKYIEDQADRAPESAVEVSPGEEGDRVGADIEMGNEAGQPHKLIHTNTAISIERLDEVKKGGVVVTGEDPDDLFEAVEGVLESHPTIELLLLEHVMRI